MSFRMRRLVVVNHLDIGRTLRCPPEANPVLIIDANAVLAAPVVPQGFQHIARRYAKVAQQESGIQVVQFAPCYATQPYRTCSTCRGRVQAVEEILGPSVCKRPDHDSI